MAWIESHQELGHHPKTRRLARMLGISLPAAVGHLHYLWWWALDYAEDGDLSPYDAADIAEAALWDGDPDLFVRALLECGPGDKWGFLERTDDGRLVLHDWREYAGALVDAREAQSVAGARGNHERWHRGRGIFREDCPFCQQERAEASGDRLPIGSRSGGDSARDRVLSHQTQHNRDNQSSSTEPRSGYRPATATDVMIADDSVTPGRFFERLWASLPPTIDQLIADYEGRLHASAIKWAIWEARLQGQRRASYLRAILDRLVAQGLTTAAAAQEEADRRHLRQAAGAEVAAARDRPLEGVANAAAYRPVDPELVREYAARIYGDDAGAASAADKPP